MRRLTASVIIVAVSLVTVAFAVAQQSGSQHGAMQPPGASAPISATPQDHDAHHAQHMEMCRQLMGQQGMMGGGMGSGMMRDGMMGPGMMGGGMMPMMSGDPKQQAEMMAMRGEMMKAMGDIMLKYAQRAQSAK
jgi:hypothetical protein